MNDEPLWTDLVRDVPAQRGAHRAPRHAEHGNGADLALIVMLVIIGFALLTGISALALR